MQIDTNREDCCHYVVYCAKQIHGFAQIVCCIKLFLRLGFAFINKSFLISNQSLFSEEAIPPPPSLTLLPFPCPSQQNWHRQK